MRSRLAQYLLSVHGPAEYDEALTYASRACQGKVEVRPFQSKRARHTRRSPRAQRARVVAPVTRRFGDLDIRGRRHGGVLDPQTTSEPNARWWLVTRFLSTPLALSSA
jgi:hypothetical protein